MSQILPLAYGVVKCNVANAVGEPGIIEPHLVETPAKRAYLSGVFCALRKFRGLAAIMSIYLIASSNVIQVRRVG